MKPYHATHTCDQTSQEADHARVLEAENAALKAENRNLLGLAQKEAHAVRCVGLLARAEKAEARVERLESGEIFMERQFRALEKAGWSAPLYAKKEAPR